MGRHLSQGYGQVILVSGYPALTAVNWSQHWCAIHGCDISLPVLPNWQKSVRIKHWFSSGADGRAGGRCTVTWLPNFLGWADLLTHGAPQARFARQSSTINLAELFYFIILTFRKNILPFALLFISFFTFNEALWSQKRSFYCFCCVITLR